MSIDPSTPVIVGVAQHTQRPDDLTQALEPVALMELAVRTAADDAGNAALLSKLDIIGVVQGAWKYTNPARLIADRDGARGAQSSLSANGGNTPQSYLNHFARRIASGEISGAALCGAETIWSRRRLRREGIDQPNTEQVDVEPDERFGDNVTMGTEFERSRGMEMPINFYPLFDSAIRASRGESIDEHRTRLANLWQGFNEQAVANDHAWSRTAMTADEIREPGKGNRMVGFPYTKAMNSNWDLDQGAAVLMCSAQLAEDLNIPRDRWVFPWAGTDAHDTYSVTNRRDLHSSPAITEAGKALFTLADKSPDDVAHIDLYSCFPSAVQVGAASIGFGEDRQLTQTGGLTFAGGPLNNYVTHSIAAMVDTLRSDPGTLGLVSANGGYLTKHAIGLYSTEPSGKPFGWASPQDVIDQAPQTASAEEYSGAAEVEAYTVMHNAEGPEVGLCALRTPDGARTWGQVTDTGAMAEMISDEAIGRRGDLSPEGEFAFA